MTTYVRAARRRDDHPSAFLTVTGGVLHLAVYGYDAPHTTVGFPIGRHLPLCGGQRTPRVEAWQITGPWAARWSGHAHWPICRDCIRTLERLAGDATDHELRARAAETERTNP